MNKSSKLYQSAVEAYQKAYAPYSKFKVGSAVLSTNGNIYNGCNVENISYPCGTCAEQNAISTMVTNGDLQIAEILIIADGQSLITPCGACLQRIQELSTPNTIIHLADLEGIKQSLPLSDFLPLAFNAEELTK